MNYNQLIIIFSYLSVLNLNVVLWVWSASHHCILTELVHCSIGASLHIMNTSLESLDLVSLKEMKNGFAYVAANQRLCYWPPARYWHTILGDNQFYGGRNKNHSTCSEYDVIAWLSQTDREVFIA